MGILKRLQALFAWREVGYRSGWTYFENAATGEREAVQRVGAGWHPVDIEWLAERNGRLVDLHGGKYVAIPRVRAATSRELLHDQTATPS